VIVWYFVVTTVGFCVLVLSGAGLIWLAGVRSQEWSKLVDEYPRRNTCSGKRWSRTTLRINRQSWRPVRNTIGVDETGLFLGRSVLIGVFVFPPIQIPWTDVALRTDRDRCEVLLHRSGVSSNEHVTVIRIDPLVGQQISTFTSYQQTGLGNN
jgi:hypothetical protein